MNSKPMAIVTLAGLAVATGACGNLADPPAAMSVRYASDGTLVVFAGSVIDTYGPDLVRKVHIPTPPVLGPVFSVSDDGSMAALASSISGHQVAVFNLSGSDGKVTDLGQSPNGTHTYSPQGLLLSPTGDLLFVVGGVGGQVDVSGMLDTATGAMRWTVEASYGVRALFSGDESALYTLGTSGDAGSGLQKFDSLTGTVGLDAPSNIEAFGGMSDPHTLIGVAVSVDPVSYAESTEIELLSTADGTVTRQVSLGAGTVFAGNVFNPPAFTCAPAAGSCVLPVAETDPSGSSLTNAIQVRALDGTLVQSIENAGGDVAISPDGQYVASVFDGDVIIYRVSDGSQVKQLPYRNQIL